MGVKIGEAFVEFTARRAKKFDDVSKQVKAEAAATAKVASSAAGSSGSLASAAKTAAGGLMMSGKEALAAAGPLGIAAAAVLTLGGAFTKVLPAIRAASDELKELKTTADVAGYSVQELTATAYAMERAGGKLSDFLGLREGWNKQVMDLQFGTGRAGAAMRLLGVSATDAKGKLRDIEEVLPQLVRAMQQFGHADQRRLADAIFGGSAEAFLKIVAQGEQGFKRMKAVASFLGTTTSQATADSGARLSDTMGTLGDQLSALWKNLVGVVSPLLLPMLAQLIAALAVINRLLEMINTVFIAPLNALLDRGMRGFEYMAEKAKQIDEYMTNAKNLLTFGPGGAAALTGVRKLFAKDDKANSSPKALGTGAISALQGGGMGAQLMGLTDFARNMVQAAAGRMGTPEAQLQELKSHTALLSKIAGQDQASAGLEVAP